MEKSKTFKDLFVWQKAHKLVLEIYKESKSFPDDERYGLTQQLRRAAVSVPANVVEGYKRKGRQDKLRFLNISEASLEECRYYFILAKDLSFISSETYSMLEGLADEVCRLLISYSSGIIANTSNYVREEMAEYYPLSFSSPITPTTPVTPEPHDTN